MGNLGIIAVASDVYDKTRRNDRFFARICQFVQKLGLQVLSSSTKNRYSTFTVLETEFYGRRSASEAACD